jgi:hypothetical protein
VSVDGALVEVDATPASAPGRTLIYEFDFDEDGAPDRRGTSPRASWPYEGSGTYTIRVTVRDPKWDSTRTLKHKVTIR